MDVTAEQAHAGPKSEKVGVLEVLGVSTRLGLTSLSGPIAHLGYFHDEYVARRRWLNEQTYADLVALCQFLPGPPSSQVGIAIGMMRAGVLGGIAAWLGFTVPSALALVAFAYGLQTLGITEAGWLHGLKVVAVAVVAQAVWGMARTLAPDRERASLALLAAIAMLAYPMAVGQVLIIVIAGLIGWWWLAEASAPRDPGIRVSLGHRGAAVAWGVFFGLPIGLPIIQRWVQAGYQCRGGGAALSRPLSPGMDECDPCPRRHSPGADRLRPPRFLEMAPLARRNSLRIGWCSSCASLTDPLVTMRRKLPGANTSAYDTMLSDREEVSVGQVARKLVQYQHIRAHRPDTQWLGLSMMTAPEV